MKQTLVSHLVPDIIRKIDLKQVREYLIGDSYELVCNMDGDILPERRSELEQILVKYARKNNVPNSVFHRKLMDAGIIKDFDKVIVSCLINPSDRSKIFKEFYEKGFIDNIYSSVSVMINPYSIKSQFASLFLSLKLGIQE